MKDDIKVVQVFSTGGKNFAFMTSEHHANKFRQRMDDENQKYKTVSLNNYMEKKDQTGAVIYVRPINVSAVVVADPENLQQKPKIVQVQMQPNFRKMEGN